MTDKEIKAYIDMTARKIAEEYKRQGLLTGSRSAAYSDAAELLTAYFAEGKKDSAITYAIQGLRFDPYFRIIPLYYEQGRTNESIAEELGVDTSTVVRNKRRLCLLIYDAVT